jgi:N-methylhydantoinase A
VQRGHNPRDYTPVAFGGAGPFHATRLARELEMRRILVPLMPGIMCAAGRCRQICAPILPAPA